MWIIWIGCHLQICTMTPYVSDMTWVWMCRVSYRVWMCRVSYRVHPIWHPTHSHPIWRPTYPIWHIFIRHCTYTLTHRTYLNITQCISIYDTLYIYRISPYISVYTTLHIHPIWHPTYLYATHTLHICMRHPIYIPYITLHICGCHPIHTPYTTPYISISDTNTPAHRAYYDMAQCISVNDTLFI